MMEKAATLDVDHVLFDLEDACAPSEKEAARALAVQALMQHEFGRSIRAVRINDVTTPWCRGDIESVVLGAGDAVETLIVPKVEDASHVHFVADLVAKLEADAGGESKIELEVQIESALGAVNLREIVRASDRIAAVVFGPGDYAASLGIPQQEIGMIDARYPGHQWHWIMCELAVHARSVGAQAIDGPYVDFGDESGFAESAQRARLLGFDGKWCIHPNQVPWANTAFSPSKEELAQARSVVAAFDASLAAGTGAIAVDGRMVDEASRKMAEATIARDVATTSREANASVGATASDGGQ
jgi:citrate lyase subunit beta/citryl-CoA lyase